MNFHRYLITAFFSIYGLFANGQESHYWSTQVGAKSTMLSGAVVGAVRDNSAIYYNPGGLAFIENSSLSIVGDVYFYDYLQMENGAGDGIDLYANKIEANPQIISGIIKNAKRPWMTVNYSFLTRHISAYNTSAKNSMYYDIYEASPGDEMYTGNFEKDGKIREDWLGIGHGYKVSPVLGIGFSLFLTMRTEESRQLLEIATFDQNQNQSPLVANGIQNRNVNLNYFSAGLLAKFGYSLNYDKLKIGGNITLPRVPINFVSRASYIRSEQYLVPTISDSIYKSSFHQKRAGVFYKSPVSIDFGANYKVNKNNYYITVAYFGRVKQYNLIRPDNYDNESIEGKLNPQENNFNTVSLAHKQVFNIAIGYERSLNESLNFMLGGSTDFNPNDWSNINDEKDYTSLYSAWNIYHFSGGFELKGDKLNLTLGWNIGIGKNKNQKQFFNLSSPNEYNDLLGERNNNVNSTFIRSSLVLGFIYYFDDKPDISQSK